MPPLDLSAVEENAIISIDAVKENATIRADNGSQYTSNAFRKSMSVLRLKLEHIACNTPEQNGHKTLKKEIPYEFISNWKQEHQRETEEVAEQQSKVINIG